MIPHQLQIKNFLSYGPETQIIDFSNYHLICLSGKNGHGKSAMLDAITWAIWGQARKSSGNSKPDAGLLHLGQKHMMVILEFEVNGQHYRVRREFLNTATKPFATLDFGIKNAEGKLTALTDKTIKDTQEKIERIIGITYESFTNSTFLRQGQSNEFSKKLPKERKEILAQILQLSKFEDQKKIALQHARKLQIDWTTQSNIAQRIDQELQNLASVQEQYQIIVHNLENIETQHKILTATKLHLTTQTELLQQKSNEQIFFIRQQEEIENNIRTLNQDILKIQTALNIQTLSIDPAQLQLEEQQLTKLIQEQQIAYQQKLQLKEKYLIAKETLTEQTSQIQQAYQHQQHTLKIKIAQTQETLYHFQKQLQHEQQIQIKFNTDAQKFKNTVDLLRKDLQTLSTIKQEQEQAQENFEKNKTMYQNLCIQGANLKQQLVILIEKQNHTSHHKKDICSECEQPLSPEQQKKILKILQLKQTETEQALTQMRHQTQNLKTTLTTQHVQLQQLQKSCDHYILLTTKLEEQFKQYENLKEQCQIQETTIMTHQAALKTLQTQVQDLENNLQILDKDLQQQLQCTELVKMQENLITIEQQAKQIIYQAQQHQELNEKLNKIRALLTQTTNATEQAEQQQQLKQLQKNLNLAQEQFQTIEKQLLKFTELEPQRQELMQQQQNLEKNMQELSHAHQKFLIEKGSLETKQKKQLELQEELTAITLNIKILYEEMIDYQEIAKALGKDGIQALLIEQAIPEIEHETNQILARLTNNQTQIFIESLRDLKKGGSKETLDIKISDSFGLRDYEMFSGGEAFRIDFALRIGISKLLARRAGTTLQTIFIDEGFGSQDEEGLQLIMDNIYKIQDDFAKIIIVSHLPEMKEQFPVQFIIEKKRCGSTVSIVHQG